MTTVRKKLKDDQNWMPCLAIADYYKKLYEDRRERLLVHKEILHNTGVNVGQRLKNTTEEAKIVNELLKRYDDLSLHQTSCRT